GSTSAFPADPRRRPSSWRWRPSCCTEGQPSSEGVRRRPSLQHRRLRHATPDQHVHRAKCAIRRERRDYGMRFRAQGSIVAIAAIALSISLSTAALAARGWTGPTALTHDGITGLLSLHSLASAGQRLHLFYP